MRLLGCTSIPVALAIAALVWATGARTVHAERFYGDCEATLNGVDISALDSHDPEQAIPIDPQEPIHAELRTTHDTRSFRLYVDDVPVVQQIDVARQAAVDGPQRSWTATIEPDEGIGRHQNLGVGLYRVVAEASNGPGRCAGAAMIRLVGNWWETLLGISATVAVVVAGIALTVTAGNSGLAVVRVGLRIMFGRGRKERERAGAWWRPRLKWSFGMSLGASFAGLVFGGGLTLLLQQAAVAPFSLELTLRVVLLSALIPPALEGQAVFERTIYAREAGG